MKSKCSLKASMTLVVKSTSPAARQIESVAGRKPSKTTTKAMRSKAWVSEDQGWTLGRYWGARSMPASQVDIRRQTDLGEFVGRTIRAVILKIDEERRNIVISRRKLQEKERAEARDTILRQDRRRPEGHRYRHEHRRLRGVHRSWRRGRLLHITDMSWGRINHPSEMLKHGQEIEVMILKIDREKKIASAQATRKLALGNLDERFPVNSRVKGKVVNW